MKIKRMINEAENITVNDIEKEADKIHKEQEAGAAQVDKKQAAAVQKKEGSLERELTAILDSNLAAEKVRKTAEYKEKHGINTNLKYLGPQNILISGPAGVGKSGIIEDWAKNHHIHLVKITGAELNPDLVQGAIFKDMKEVNDIADDAEYARLADRRRRNINTIEKCYEYLRNWGIDDVQDWNEDDIEGAIEDYNIQGNHQSAFREAIAKIQDASKKVIEIDSKIGKTRKEMHSKMVTTDFFQSLNEKRSVLFIDEINRSNPRVRATILDMIQSHNIPDSNSSTNRTFLPNFLFTIAAQNPTSDQEGHSTGSTYGTGEVKPLDAAMLTRFKQKNWYPDISETREFLLKCYTAEEKEFSEMVNTTMDSEIQSEFDAQYSDQSDAEYGMIQHTAENNAIIARNKKQMVELLLRAGTPLAFNFDSTYLQQSTEAGRNTLNARTLTTLINDSMGDKERLINSVNEWVGKAASNKAEYVTWDDKEKKYTAGVFIELLRDYKPDPLVVSNKGIYDGTSELEKMKADMAAKKQSMLNKHGITQKEKQSSDIIDKAFDELTF